MDTRDTPEQAELRRSARQLARDLGPATVADLDDAGREQRLRAAVLDAGWLDLRDDAGEGAPLAGGVEAAIVAEALAEGVADVSYTGPLLAADLARRAGVARAEPRGVGYSQSLAGVALAGEPAYVVDADTAAYVLVECDGGYELALVHADDGSGADLTRPVGLAPAGTPVLPQGGFLSSDNLIAFEALGLALTSADLVGVMRGVLDVTVDYASQRKQFGVPVGSFQAVQHLLAEGHCLMEGSASIALYASWAVDNLDPCAAREAGRMAKTYCARAARTVCETAVQVHGGIGNTWECIVHVYLRRALLSTQWFGDDSEQLRALADDRLEARVGLP